MSWNIFEVVEFVVDALSLLSSDSSESNSGTEKPLKRKKSKYLVEQFSTAFTLISCIFLFFVFKDPLLVQNSFQTVCIAILIGMVITFLCCFALYLLEFFYFKSFLSMLFFCTSMIVLWTASVLFLYFKSVLF
ncbi:branched-chain amino acid ABC transporter substrate-binding protein [Chryseobacterium sp. SIMBA_038]|uniref:branched-chain amino acid ABC transporter substrate-binding protein n=1 Tax=Chryseobacterium sp. SIMBA_038 TaxID=3085780 RepID=UPI00397C6426